MSSSFFKFSYFCILLFSILSIVFFSYCIPSSLGLENISFDFSAPPTISYPLQDNGFLWPSPGYMTITSPFGKRNAPTKGASSSHSGIDIGVPTGTNLIAIISGKITLAKFQGAGGCTITFENPPYTISYCHVDPHFLVHVGQNIRQGDVIAKVGPKNVYGIPNNPYKDSNGNPTNGATTGAHLHLTIRKNGILINPLDLF